jgi:hypothetical protein
MVNWTSVLTALTTTAVVTAGVVWLVRSLVAHWLSRDVERYKSTLAAEATRELEAFRHQLQLQAAEQATTFTQLHLKRSEVIAGLYTRLVVAKEAIENFITPAHYSSDTDAFALYVSAFKRLRALYRFFARHRIYFSSDLCKAVDTLLDELHISAWEISYFHAISPDYRALTADEYQTRKLEWARFRKAVPPVMMQIEVEFRRLLGLTVQDDRDEADASIPMVLDLFEPERVARRLEARKAEGQSNQADV